jgi:hypothetical protein
MENIFLPQTAMRLLAASEKEGRLSIPLVDQCTPEQTPLAKNRLALLCQDLEAQSKSACEKAYILDLRISCESLASQKTDIRIREDSLHQDMARLVQAYSADCRRNFVELNLLLDDVVKCSDEITASNLHAPRICPTFWLRQLNKDRFDKLPDQWKKIIIRYGLAVTELNRSQRLVAVAGRPHDLAEELRNCGHQNWNPADFPETLLLEAESGITVRGVQEEIAKQMRSPPNNRNSIMQLNMGEGKSSVIIPIVAAALADQTR